MKHTERIPPSKFSMKTHRLPISLSLVIPVYNNEKTAVAEILKCINILINTVSNFEIIINDDKSTDKTLELIKNKFGNRKNIKIITNSNNRGIAKSIYSLYKKSNLEYVCLFSVDGDWEPTDIEKMIKTIYKTNADMVIGQRNKKTYTSYRKILSFFYNFLPIILFGVNTKDAGSIKVFKKKLINEIPIKSSSVFFEAELIIKASLKKHKIVFVPIKFYKKDRKSGTGGKFKLVVNSVFDLIKLRFQTAGFKL